MNARNILSGSLLLLLGACAHAPARPEFALTTPAELCSDDSLGATDFCMPSARIEALLQAAPINVLEAVTTAHGLTGPKRVVLDFPGEALLLRAKWKRAYRGATGFNNDPRKELAAAALQKLFLDESDYVVPPTVGRCLSLEHYGNIGRSARPTFKDTRCIFGVLSYWVEHAEGLRGVDKSRFESTSAYRRALGNMNLLTYLIAHADTRASNFIISRDRDRPHALSIDNGLAFGGFTNPRTLMFGEWRKIIVPRLPREPIERLRKLTRQQLDTLLVVAQFEVIGDQLNPVPPTAPINVTDGVRRQGKVIQLGLTRAEVDAVERRLKSLLERVASGKLPLD